MTHRQKSIDTTIKYSHFLHYYKLYKVHPAVNTSYDGVYACTENPIESCELAFSIPAILKFGSLNYALCIDIWCYKLQFTVFPGLPDRVCLLARVWCSATRRPLGRFQYAGPDWRIWSRVGQPSFERQICVYWVRSGQILEADGRDFASVTSKFNKIDLLVLSINVLLIHLRILRLCFLYDLYAVHSRSCLVKSFGNDLTKQKSLS